MKNKQVWLITGAGRGMGVDIAKAALAAGYQVVAIGTAEQVIATLQQETNAYRELSSSLAQENA